MSRPTLLSPHFSIDELQSSQTATRRGIRNIASPGVQVNLRRLCETVLEPLRASVGALQISSGYRSIELNLAVGGSIKSAHCLGLAADVLCAGLRPRDLCQRIIDLHLPFDQLIYEGSWTHVAIAKPGAAPRGEVLTARFKDGKASYHKELLRLPGDER